MRDLGAVVLVTGPMGSGKTTLADAFAGRHGWTGISEDDHWVAHGWSGPRTPDQERVVQRQVLDTVTATAHSGRSVIVEFVLYREPPNPLTAYGAALAGYGIDCCAVLLRPSLEVVMTRIAARGRPDDLDRPAQRRLEVTHQLRMLDAWTDVAPTATDSGRFLVLDTSTLGLPDTLRALEQWIGPDRIGR